MRTEIEEQLYKEWSSKNRISVYALAVPILGSIAIGIASLIMLFWGDSSFWAKILGTCFVVYVVSSILYYLIYNDYIKTRKKELFKGNEFNISKKSNFQKRLDDYYESSKSN